MTILLTGASGFLGRHVLAQLEGQPLRLLVLPDDPTLPELRKQAEVVTGDVTRPESLSLALDGVTQVMHLAGHVNGGRGRAETFMAVNAQGTANLAQAARAAGVAQFIYTSSITVYGYVRDADEAAPLVFTPGYPASKIHAERAVRQLLPAQATILRLPLVLGAGDTGFMCPGLHGLQQAGRVVLVGSGLAPWSVLAATTVVPLMYRAAGEQRKTVIAAISSGSARRCVGMSFSTADSKSSCSRWRNSSSCSPAVATNPGARALTVTPCRAQ